MSTTLSTIAGVTVYATKAAALAGAVDSGVAFNAWMRLQTSSPGAPITLLWDGWIYVADMAADFLQYTPNASGFITHKPADGMTTAGAVWAHKTTASSCLRNGATNYAISVDNISNVTFTTNAAGVGLTFAFGVVQGDGTPHDDSTWGWLMGLQAVGINSLVLQGVNLQEGRGFNFFAVGCDGVAMTDCTSLFTARTDVDCNGFHFDGPCNHITVTGCLCTGGRDDAYAFDADEPYYSVNLPNYRAGLMAGWTGGDIPLASITNCGVVGHRNALRTLSQAHTLGAITVNGFTGSITTGVVLVADNYDEESSGTLTIGTLSISNFNIASTGTSDGYKIGRMYIHGNIGVMNFDWTTITPCADATGITSMYLYVHPASVITTPVFGPNLSLIVDDMFTGGNGAPGNGWTDADGKFTVTGGKLIATCDGGSHKLLRAESALNTLSIVRYAAASHDLLFEIARHVGTTEYELVGYFDGLTTDLSSIGQFYSIVNGVPTLLLNSYSGQASTNNSALIQYGAVIGNNLILGTWDSTNGRWIVPLASVKSTTIAAAGVTGIGQYGPTGTMTISRISNWAVYGALLGLTAIRSGSGVVLAWGAFAGADHYQVSKDGGAFVTRASPWTDTGAANANHTYIVQAVDGSGNVIAQSGTAYVLPSQIPGMICLGIL